MAVRFFSKGVDKPLLRENEVEKWISLVVSSYSRQLGELNYVFCADDYLLQLNKEHLGHNYYTDILTFDLSDKGNTVEGDVYISTERAAENARILNIDYVEEILRLIIHGVLHLLGFKDDSDNEKKEMREAEDLWLKKLIVPRGT